MESIPPTPIPGRAPAAVAAGKSFYQRWQERWDEIAALMGRDVPVEMEQVQWLVGTWSTGITSYATPTRPERTNEHPEARFRWSSALGGHWLLFEGEYRPANRFLFRYVGYLTYDPCCGRWVDMLIEHPAGWWVMTAPGWTGDQLVFAGTMQLLGETVEIRHRLVKLSDDAWKWENDEKQVDGTWLPIDEHRFTRVVDDEAMRDA